MSKITKLNDIEIYREALHLAQIAFRLVADKKILREYFLIDQLKRAALSIAANIAEGYGRNTKKDFSQFLSIALGSVNEVITYLDFIELQYNLDTSELKDKYDNFMPSNPFFQVISFTICITKRQSLITNN